MDQQNATRDRILFSALLPILGYGSKQLNTKKKRAQCILDHKNDLGHLINLWTLDGVNQTAARLASRAVFKSPAHAEIYFPGSLEASNASRRQEKVLPRSNDAVKVLEPAPKESTKDQDQPAVFDDMVHLGSDDTAVESSDALIIDNPQPEPVFQPKKITSSPLLFVSLPQEVQHHLLSDVQRLLEQACYAFAHQYFPGVLISKGWYSAEYVEITRWREILPSFSAYLDQKSRKISPTMLHNTLHTVAKLRHAAVHREPLSVAQVDFMLENSITLAQLVRDVGRVEQLRKIREQVRVCVEKIRANKDRLYRQLRRDIDEKRKELARLEQQMERQAVQEDREYCLVTCKHLQRNTQLTMKFRPWIPSNIRNWGCQLISLSGRIGVSSKNVSFYGIAFMVGFIFVYLFVRLFSIWQSFKLN